VNQQGSRPYLCVRSSEMQITVSFRVKVKVKVIISVNFKGQFDNLSSARSRTGIFGLVKKVRHLFGSQASSDRNISNTEQRW
jgi:hypothetical protein